MAHANTILTPNLTKADDQADNTTTLTIEPLHTGYGTTLGNSVRRVLLSSIAGSAIIAFKIAEATHEFTTVDGVKEDVVDIMLNLKHINIKVHSDEPVNLRLSTKKAGVVTAGDIEANSDIEIVDPSQPIATIDGSSTFTIDMLAEQGRGYLTVEERQESVPSDMIAIDALYSPVTRVRYNVESTRVGQITNLDKLVISIKTDGTITPKDAFEEANAILKSQYEALAGQTTVATSQVDRAPVAPVVAEVADDGSELNTSIEDLGLSARTTNALINNEIHTVSDLISLTDSDLKELKGFGNKAMEEVQDKISELSL
ncbi:DNA-directed RNA polymerase subunit alpha [Candidatus Saccharibacteria bacterium]|jgi:DNA-directed RNA polymerase subunit alpha|nr:DNA-directed RNA polymerase subunit alpha [Candidatus Saccharibacteria bacterium]